MKKLITSSLTAILLFILCSSQTLFAQKVDSKEYETIKADFWKKCQTYKSNLEHNVTTQKPVDPSGLFMIDDENNFVQKTEPSIMNDLANMNNAPWKNAEPDLVGVYTWGASSGTYTAITGGTALGTSSNDDNTFSANPIGFNFIYDGLTYTTVDVNANGYIKFGTISGSHYPWILSLQTLIAAALDNDLRANNTTSVLQYLTQGSSPNRTWTLQWSNYGFYSGGWDGSDVSFQVILTESTNTIKVVYGAFTTIVVQPYTNQVGINNALTDFNCRTNTTDWITTTAGGSNTAAMTLSSTNKPASGLTWTWTPPVPSNMGYVSSNTLQITPGAPVVASSINNPIIQIQVVDTGSANPISITKLRLETTGSNNPGADIANANVYYTGSSNVFSAAAPFGSVVPNPSGVFNVTGSQQLIGNATNYFWVTYDIKPGAIIGDSVDAQCDSIIGNGTMGGRVPTTVAPAGSRPIGSPLCGIYTIPGSFPSIAAAISALNSIPITCPVTFNVAANYVETAANLVISGTGTAGATVTFKKNGAGANPRIRAGVGVGATDAIIKFNGVSYFTFDGIDLVDTSVNVNTTTQMEYGYAFYRLDPTHACQNITIKNCNISLFKTNTSTYGIYGNYINLAGTFITPTTPAGSCVNISLLSNNITNCFGGIYMYGYSDATFPFIMNDHNLVISTSGSGARSSITNFGGNSGTCYGMNLNYQDNATISNTYINNTGTGTGHTGYIYGISHYHFYDNGNDVISGDTLTLNDTTSAFGVLYAIYDYSYYGRDHFITNNVIKNCVNPTTSSYNNFYIYSYFAAGSSTYQNSLTLTGNKVFNNSLGVAGSTSGASSYDYYCYDYSYAFNNISNNLDSANSCLGLTNYLNYGIYSPGTTNAQIISNNRIVNNTMCGTSTASTTYGIYAGAGYLLSSVDSNVVSNNSFPTTGSHTFYNMYNSSVAAVNDYSYNTVDNNTSTGSGTFYGMYYIGSPAFGVTANITNNKVTNLNKTTATGTGTIYGIANLGSATGTLNINNNTITGFSSAAATGYYGIYQNGSPTNFVNINGNKIGNFTNGGVSTIYGIYHFPSGSTQNVIAQDSIFNITSPGSTIYGMYLNSSLLWNIWGNRILGLSSTTSTTPQVFGIYSNVSSSSTMNIYNNFISDLKTPAGTLTPSIAGIYIPTGTSTQFINLYYNTIYLAATSTSATTFGTAGVYAITTPTVEMKNNVIVNNSTPGPTGGNTVAYQRTSTTVTTYTSGSNNNCLYAGVPAANKLVYFDGTNLVQTMAAYKNLVSPRDEASVTENPPFVNVATTPYDLRIQTAVGTQLESGGRVISTSTVPPSSINITTDAFNTARYPNAGYPIGGFVPNAPDIGAHEFGGLNADLAGPNINYSALGIGAIAANRAFNNVTITDPSGVNITTLTKPRCYYKRSTDGNVINDNTSGTDGWKYVEANGTTSPFDFTINYGLLIGGTGVVAGQIINYFVIAQDLIATPNVSWNAATFTTTPTTVGLVSGNAPITNTLSYTIGTGGSFGGTVLVGIGQTFTSLTAAGGLFSAINAGTVTNNLTISVTSDLLLEDGTNALNLTSEAGPGGYRIRLVPSSAVAHLIQGSVAQGLIRLNGTRRFTVDGNNGFGGKYLTFRNPNGSNPTFTFINDAVGDSLKGCTIESNNTNTASGSIVFSTTTGVQGNDSNVIANCDIRDRSDATGNPANGIYSLGTTTQIPYFNSNNIITGCNFFNNYVDIATTTAAIYMTSGTTDWTITGNSFYQTGTRNVTTGQSICGIFCNGTNTNNLLIQGNYFGGTAPSCAGSAMTYTGTGLYLILPINITPGLLAPSSIQGNFIQNMNLTESPASGSTNLFRGISVIAGYCNIGNVVGNVVGSPTGNGSITLSINTTTTGYTTFGILTQAIGNVSNNSVGSITVGGTAAATTAFSTVGIQWSNTTPGWTYVLNNNLIGSLSTPNSIQFTDTLSAGSIRGITWGNGVGTLNNITNNTVSNLTSFSQASTSVVLATVYALSASTAGNFNITGNTFVNMTDNTNGLAPSTFTVLGIAHSSTGVYNISNNVIASNYLNCPGASANGLNAGMFVGGGAGTLISKNKLYDLRYSGLTIPTTAITGLFISNGAPGNMEVSNNMISLTNGDPTDVPFGKQPENMRLKHEYTSNVPLIKQSVPLELFKDNIMGKVVTDAKVQELSSDLCHPEYVDNGQRTTKDKAPTIGRNNVNSTNAATIIGIVSQTGAQPAIVFYYYNSIYIGGTQPGGSTANSWCFLKQFTAPHVLRNNLFVNARTGGTGFQYAIGNESSPLISSWSATASNYNVYVVSNDANVGEWSGPNTIAQFRTNSLGDNQSWQTNTATVIPANLFTSIPTCNLTILSGNAAAWVVSGKGIALPTVNTDFFGNARGTTIQSGCTDVGANEFAATPPGNPNATFDNAPGSGVTSTYTVYGRTVAVVNWGAGGTSYPTSVSVNYYSGVNPVSNITTPPFNSNSYWLVTPTGNLTGTTYAMTLYFGDNETYNITSPSTNTLLAKLGAFWQVFPPGTGAQQSNLNWPGFTVKATGLKNFSTYALSDAALPTPNLLTPLDGADNQPAALNLVWNKSAGATSYRVQLATDSLFVNLIVNDAAVTDSIRAVSGLLNNQNYWWRVNGTNGIGTGAWTQVFRFRVLFVQPPALVNMNVIPGGFYNTGTGRLNMRDTLRILLIDSATCNRMDSSRVVVDSVTFGFQASFSNAPTGNYYIMVFHRNHLPISSRLKQSVTRGSTVAYDFTNDSTKTFGNNVTRVAVGKYGMIPGDANHDQFVDGLDQTIWIGLNGGDGYLSADFNGDGFVDGLDQTIWILFNGNSSFLPCGITVPDLLRWEKEQVSRKTVGNIKINPIIINGSTNKNK